MAEESKGKMLLRIKGMSPGPYTSNHRNAYIRFAMVSKPENGVRRQATPFFTCRDFINDALRARVHDITDDCKYSTDIDLTKFRMLIGRDCKNRDDRYAFKAKLFSAKRLLNFYEGVAGWNDPSTITTVRLENGSAKNAWLLTGPEKWLRYSQLTSMITLIFRIIANHGPIEFTNIDDVESWFAGLVNDQKDSKRSGIYHIDHDLQTYLPATYQKFYMIMKYYDEIFIDPLEQAYPKDGSVHSTGGIYQLCSFATGCKSLDNRMKDTWKKYEKERQERVKAKVEEEYKMKKGAPSL